MYSIIKGVDRTRWENHLDSVSFAKICSLLSFMVSKFYIPSCQYISYDEPIHLLSSSTPVPIHLQAVSSYNNVKLFWTDGYVLFLSPMLFSFDLPLSVLKNITALSISLFFPKKKTGVFFFNYLPLSFCLFYLLLRLVLVTFLACFYIEIIHDNNYR